MVISSSSQFTIHYKLPFNMMMLYGISSSSQLKL